MSDAIIASVLAKAALDPHGNADGAADADGNGTAGLPAEPVVAGTDEAGDRADANDDAEVAANADPDAEAEADADANRDETADDPAEEDDSDGDDPADDDDNPADDGDGSDDDDPGEGDRRVVPLNDDGEQGVEVVEVAEDASCLALPSRATTVKEDRRLAELRGKGSPTLNSVPSARC